MISVSHTESLNFFERLKFFRNSNYLDDCITTSVKKAQNQLVEKARERDERINAIVGVTIDQKQHVGFLSARCTTSISGMWID